MATPINLLAKMILYGPSHVGDQTIARVVRRDDGSGYVETWHAGEGWQKGGASFDEFILARPVSPEMARRQRLEMGGRYEG
jgi:hypothetical protein